MKRLFLILLLLLGCLSAQGYVITTVTVQLTNTIFGTSNYMTITANGDTRRWTNQVYVPSTQILTNASQSGSAGNLLNHLSLYPFSGVGLSQSATTNVILISGQDAALNVSASAGWATLVTNTYTYGTSNISVVVPDPYVVATKTLVYSGLMRDLNDSHNTNQYFWFTNVTTGEWMRLTNNLLVISNSVSGRFVSISNGVVTANSFSGSSSSATTATYTTGNNLPLTNSISSTNNLGHYGLFNTNDETHSYFQSTNDMALGTNAPTGEYWRETNGYGLFSAGVFLPTNAVNTGVFTAGKGYQTNISGNITLGAFAGVPAFSADWWCILIRSTNSDTSTHTTTFPSGVVGSGDGTPAVGYTTNAQVTWFMLLGFGDKATNLFTVHIWP